MSNTDRLTTKLIRHRIIRFDKSRTYKLPDGTESCLFIDFRLAVSFPDLQCDLCQLYCDEITKPFAIIPDCIIGVPDDSIPMAAQIASNLGLPLLMIRKESKHSGGDLLIDGNVKRGAKVIVIDDIIVTGSSCVDIVRKLRDCLLKPIRIISLLKRYGAGGAVCLERLFRGDGELYGGIVPMKSLLCVKDIEFSVKLKESRLCVAVDVDCMSDLTRVVEKLHRHVSIIKLHIDMITDFEPYGSKNSIQSLQNLKNRYGVLLWEDSKFADIAQITHRQIIGGIHQISSWADIVSVHSIAGPDIFKTASGDYLDGCKIVVIGEMSSPGNLLDSSYLDRTLDMLDPLRHNILNKGLVINGADYGIAKNVVGITVQTDVDTNLLKIVSGIRHDAGDAVDAVGIDTNGVTNHHQWYRKPSEVPWADILIVGSGITDYIDSELFESVINQYI